MKTVWHWKNIGKAWLFVIAAAILFGFIANALELSGEISSLLGFFVGFVAMLFSVVKWDLWHFE